MAVAMKQKDLRSDSWNHRGVSGREDVNKSATTPATPAAVKATQNQAELWQI